MKILWTEPAAKDLEHIEDYIKQDNPVVAIDVVLNIINTAETLLSEHSNIGRAGRVHGTRELVVSDYPSYIIVYRVIENKLEIVRVLHGARKWPDSF
ncbi:MAG: type II toxin-antitoxin system RelE/ParE family toxin [Candidatus Anammoxibacter sp.]